MRGLFVVVEYIKINVSFAKPPPEQSMNTMAVRKLKYKSFYSETQIYVLINYSPLMIA